ncbi:HigA family addiction module antitoxin [Salininema proteolyticum]|uniref:HigA family addiction module antitoxin n=1 Tax=Salininema proteolyticum TaxID=1607685 RepID=A0ABV8TWY3_9ACTN
MRNQQNNAPVHPGKVLMDDFLAPLRLSQTRVARTVGVPPRRINEIVLGKRGITPDTALRLGRFFGNGPAFWMNLQARHDLKVERDKLGPELRRIAPLGAFLLDPIPRPARSREG